MRKLILAACCIGLLSACKRPQGEQIQQVAPIRVAYEVMDVDGCEYIHLGIPYSGWTHKGNCKNPAHGKGYYYPSKLITCPKCGKEIVESGEKCK